MIRLAIAVLHTALAVGTTSAALLLVGQARANAVWEQSFYGATSDTTGQLLVAGLLSMLFGLGHGAGAWAWFAGAEWGGWALIAASLVLAAGAPWGVVSLLSVTAFLVMGDVMVERRRAALRALQLPDEEEEPPTR